VENSPTLGLLLSHFQAALPDWEAPVLGPVEACSTWNTFHFGSDSFLFHVEQAKHLLR